MQRQITAGDYVTLGDLYYKKYKLDKAIGNYTKAIELDPNMAMAYNNRGLAYKISENSDNAMNDFNKALSLNPNIASIYKNRADLRYFLKQNFDQAINDYQEALKIDPNYISVYINLGLTYKAQEKFDEAIASFNKAIALNPNHITAYENRGIVYEAQQKFDEAITDFNKVIELDPSNTSAYVDRAAAYHKSGKIAEAIFDLSTAIKLDPMMRTIAREKLDAILAPYSKDKKTLYSEITQDRLPIKKEISLLKEAVNWKTTSGKIFWKKRGYFPCSLNRGVLGMTSKRLNSLISDIDNVRKAAQMIALGMSDRFDEKEDQNEKAQENQYKGHQKFAFFKKMPIEVGELIASKSATHLLEKNKMEIVRETFNRYYKKRYF